MVMTNDNLLMTNLPLGSLLQVYCSLTSQS